MRAKKVVVVQEKVNGRIKKATKEMSITKFVDEMLNIKDMHDLVDYVMKEEYYNLPWHKRLFLNKERIQEEAEAYVEGFIDARHVMVNNITYLINNDDKNTSQK